MKPLDDGVIYLGGTGAMGVNITRLKKMSESTYQIGQGWLLSLRKHMFKMPERMDSFTGLQWLRSHPACWRECPPTRLAERVCGCVGEWGQGWVKSAQQVERMERDSLKPEGHIHLDK